MSTKTTTATTNQYNQGGMNAYNAFQPQIQNTLSQMVSNPLGNSYFQNQLAQQQAQSHQVSARNNQNLLSNIRAGGGILSNSGGFTAAALNRGQIGNNLMQSNAFNSSLNMALQNRNVGLAAMQGYQPLQTGQTSVQSTGGVGTWLTPLLGAAANFAMPGLGSMLGGGSFGGGYSANPQSH